MKQWLYKKGEEPRIFKGEDAIEEALENGWKDTPVLEAPKEGGTSGAVSPETPEMIDGEFSIFKKTGLIEIVGFFANGDFFVQNQGDDSDRWRIPKDTFDATYAEKTEDDKGYTTPITSLNDEDFNSLLDNIKEECVVRGIEIAEVIPHDIDGDGEGDVDLNTLDRDGLYEMALKAELSVPHNIGKEKLIEKLQESKGE